VGDADCQRQDESGTHGIVQCRKVRLVVSGDPRFGPTARFKR
jgi:hypothetical protein